MADLSFLVAALFRLPFNAQTLGRARILGKTTRTEALTARMQPPKATQARLLVVRIE